MDHTFKGVFSSLSLFDMERKLVFSFSVKMHYFCTLECTHYSITTLYRYIPTISYLFFLSMVGTRHTDPKERITPGCSSIFCAVAFFDPSQSLLYLLLVYLLTRLVPTVLVQSSSQYYPVAILKQ